MFGIVHIGEAKMAEPNIVLARIDNRLVHGQVGNSWVGASQANIIIVADDETEHDDVQKQLMKMTVSVNPNLRILFWSLDRTIEKINTAKPDQRIFIVARNPQNMRKLIDGGVPIKAVNVGNMHVGEGKRVFHEQHVYVDDQDVADFEAMKAKGIQVYVQIAPGDKKYDA